MSGGSGSPRGGSHEELRYVKMPDGAQRSRSTKTPNYESDLLFRSGKTVGPTESRPATVEEILRSHGPAQAGAAFRQQAAEAALGAAFAALTPYVQKAVEYGLESSVKGVSRLVGWAKAKVAERKSSAELAEGEEPTEIVEAEIVDDEASIGTGLKEATPPITGEEYRARLLAALAAERYAAEEKRRLADMNVADDALPSELKAALRAALERPASLLDDETLAVVVEFLNGSSTGGGQYLLLDYDGAQRLHRELDVRDPPSES